MISPWIGLGVTILCAMVGAVVRVFDFTPDQKKFVGRACVAGMLVGIVLITYGVFWGGASGSVKGPSSITQENPVNSPNFTGDNSHNEFTINPDVNSNAPVVTYHLNDERRTVTQATGVINLEEKTPQVDAFKVMAALEKDRNWLGLKMVCEEETRKTPEWLTPPLLCGRAYVELGEIEKGIERVEYVQKKVAGRKDYVIADQLREEIRRTFGK